MEKNQGKKQSLQKQKQQRQKSSNHEEQSEQNRMRRHIQMNFIPYTFLLTHNNNKNGKNVDSE